MYTGVEILFKLRMWKCYERVRRKATRMIEECNSLGYEERLKIMGLTTLETRRIRADLIEVYKVIKQLENVDEKVFF